ncbi:MAG: CvpA family protein [Gammaproteobacteria bacterium]|nr:CvpA family protein [Gammaproteobacteria bacterium]
MVWFDWLIIGITLLSAIVGAWRGFVREALSLATWIFAFWLAWAFADNAAPWFSTWIETPSLQAVAGFVLLFGIVLLVGALVNHFAALAIEKTGLSGTDRAVGLVFGILRGLVIGVVLVMVGLLMNLSRDPWWQDALLIPYFEPMANWLFGFFPEGWR